MIGAGRVRKARLRGFPAIRGGEVKGKAGTDGNLMPGGGIHLGKGRRGRLKCRNMPEISTPARTRTWKFEL